MNVLPTPETYDGYHCAEDFEERIRAKCRRRPRRRRQWTQQQEGDQGASSFEDYQKTLLDETGRSGEIHHSNRRRRRCALWSAATAAFLAITSSHSSLVVAVAAAATAPTTEDANTNNHLTVTTMDHYGKYDRIRSSPPTGVNVDLKHGSSVVRLTYNPQSPLSGGENGDVAGDNGKTTQALHDDGFTVAIARSHDDTEAQQQQRQNEERLFHIASLNPLSDGDGTTTRYRLGIESVFAAMLAIQHFNDRKSSVVPDLVTNQAVSTCNIKLTMDLYDTQLSPIVANRHLVEDVLDRRHSLETPLPCGVFGAVRSAVSSPLSIISSVHKVPMMSFISTSSELENKDVFPYFGRTMSTDASKAYAAVRYLRDVLNVTHCGVFYVKDEFGSSFHREFTRYAGLLDPPMQLVSAAYDFDGGSDAMDVAVNQLVQSGYNYFFGIWGTFSFDTFVEAASKVGLMGPDKFWLSGNTKILRDDLAYDAEKESHLARSISGMVTIIEDVPRNTAFDHAWKEMREDMSFLEYFTSKLPKELNVTSETIQLSEKSSDRENLAYDAIMSYGIAACELSEDFFDGTSLRDSLRQTSFDGASGHVEFDQRTGTRDSKHLPYAAMNIFANPPNGENLITFNTSIVAMGRVGNRSIEDSSSSAENAVDMDWVDHWRTTNATIYSDGSKFPPPVLPPPVEMNYNLIPIGVLIFGLVLASLAMAGSVYCALWTVRYRRSRVVRSSQPEFLLCLSVGAFVLASSVIPMSLQEPMSQSILNAACMLEWWLFQMGFVLAFSALFSKAWRLNQVVRASRRFQRKSVKRFKFVAPFIFLSAFTVTVLIMWNVMAPLRWERVPVNSFDRFGRSLESSGMCLGKGSGPFQLALAGVDVAALLLALRESLLSKGGGMYHESFYVGVSVACTLQAFLIGVPVLYIASRSPTSTFVVVSILVALLCSAILLPMFIPKKRARIKSMKALHRSRHSSLRPPQQTWSEVVKSHRSEESSSGSRRVVFSSFIYQVGASLSIIREEADSSADESDIESSDDESGFDGVWVQGLDDLAL